MGRITKIGIFGSWGVWVGLSFLGLLAKSPETVQVASAFFTLGCLWLAIWTIYKVVKKIASW